MPGRGGAGRIAITGSCWRQSFENCAADHLQVLTNRETLAFLLELRYPPGSTSMELNPTEKLISQKAYFLMVALGMLLLGVGEMRFFEHHPHWQMFIREAAFTLIIVVPIWLVLLKGKLKAIGEFIARKAYLFMLALAVVFLGTAELPFLEAHPHWQIFIKEVAFALILATLFAFTVERYQRQEFVKLVNKERDDLKKDIFVYAYGHDIGDQIREAMKVDILRCPFQKENLRIDWEFSELEGNADHVLLKKRQIYTLRNTTPAKQDYIFEFIQFSASEQDAIASKVFECLKVKTGTEATKQFKEAELLSSRTEPHQSTLSKNFTLA